MKLVVFAFVLASCATMLGLNVSAQQMDSLFNNGGQKKDLKRFKNALVDRAFDPDSVKFRNLVWKNPIDKSGRQIVVLCGEVNSKNRMGGYIGFQKFYSDGEGSLVYSKAMWNL